MQLSVPRAHVLEKLAEFPEPATVAQVAKACEQHANTVREHLDVLVRAGLVSRATAPAQGRGRPAILYRAEPLEARRPQIREYGTLATAMAAHVLETVTDPRAWGEASGMARGRSLIEVTETGIDAAEAAARAILHRHGFDPVDADDGTIRMRQCPVLEVSSQFPDVVCTLHQGVLTGIYNAHGVAPDRAMRITPFALPGCCLIEFPPDPESGPPVPPEPEPSRRRRSTTRRPAPSEPAPRKSGSHESGSHESETHAPESRKSETHESESHQSDPQQPGTLGAPQQAQPPR